MSSSKEETINNVKNSLDKTFSNMANSETGKKVLDRLARDRKKAIEFIENNKLALIIGIFISALVIFYFVCIYNRVPAALKRMDNNYRQLIEVSPLQYNKKVMNGNFKLCDFYVASSYKSYLPCTNYYDYASIDAIKKCIVYGARYIDLDVMNKNFNECTI